ncbi:MAG: hypothetical protein ACRDF4_03800, partial [Rhabdochlamydiaceae bacterium]
MKLHSWLLCIISLFLLASCTSQQSTIVSGKELAPSNAPNIKSVHLTDGTVVVFNSDLGRYDAKHGYIEGFTREGSRVTIPITKIVLAQLVAPKVDTAFIPVAVGVLFLAAVIGVVIALIDFLNQRGG